MTGDGRVPPLIDDSSLPDEERALLELTYGCASSAWVYAVLAEHQWIIAQYPEQAQIDVWGDDPLAVAASSLAPREAARRVPGGWR